MTREFFYKYNASLKGTYYRNPVTGKREGECLEIFSGANPTELIKAMSERAYRLIEHTTTKWGSHNLVFYKNESE